MQVRAGHPSGGSDRPDDLTALDLVPTDTEVPADWWAYMVDTPEPCWITVCNPYGPPFWIDTTTPSAAAWIGAPCPALMSVPVWHER